MSQAQIVAVSGRLDDLANGSYRVDPATARQAAEGAYLARRGDGLACLIVRLAGMCPSAMLDGGIALVPASGRVGGVPDGPWLLTIAGVALDGITSIEFLFGDGSSARATVQNNVFQLEVRGQRSTDIGGYKIAGRTYLLK